jgi:hypothetical protein
LNLDYYYFVIYLAPIWYLALISLHISMHTYCDHELCMQARLSKGRKWAKRDPTVSVRYI